MDAFTHVLKEDIINREEPEIPGFMKTKKDNRKWKMRFQVFNLEDQSDIDEIERIHTEAANSNSKETGTWIINEVGKFLDDGSYRIMVYWGEWTK